MEGKTLLVVVVIVVAIAGIGVFLSNMTTVESRDIGSDPAQVAPTDKINIIEAKTITEANNQFALNFYSQAAQDSNANLFFSPISIATAFVIAYEGARGDTAEEIQNAFGFSKDDNKRRTEFESLYKNLNEENEWYKLNMANALWIAQGFEPISDYVDIAKTYYDSQVQNVDFITNDGVNTINEWVKEKTEDKIQEILAQDSTDELTRMVITNAMYFKGKWTSQFDSRITSDESFWVDASTSVKVPMMKDVGIFNYIKTNELKALEMHYMGDKISMLVLLPHDRNGLDSLEKSLDLQKLYDLKSKMTPEPLTVHMPKFEFDTEYDLVEKLQSLGIHQAFDKDNANFDGITEDERLFIAKAIHKAFVDVNEEGTEAAAITALVVTLVSGPPEPKHEFIADHPFIFIIQEKHTGEILFMGRVMDPTK